MPENTEQQGMPCGACFRSIPIGDRYGELTDQNGHGWKICKDCISGMWQTANRYRAMVLESTSD